MDTCQKFHPKVNLFPIMSQYKANLIHGGSFFYFLLSPSFFTFGTCPTHEQATDVTLCKIDILHPNKEIKYFIIYTI